MANDNSQHWFVRLTPVGGADGNSESVVKEFSLDAVLKGVQIGRKPSDPSREGSKDSIDDGLFGSPVISRNHARIHCNPVTGKLFVHDNQSRHGTFVGAKQVESSVLHQNDVISFGKSIMKGTDEHCPIQVRVSINSDIQFPVSKNATSPQIKYGLTSAFLCCEGSEDELGSRQGDQDAFSYHSADSDDRGSDHFNDEEDDDNFEISAQGDMFDRDGSTDDERMDDEQDETTSPYMPASPGDDASPVHQEQCLPTSIINADTEADVFDQSDDEESLIVPASPERVLASYVKETDRCTEDHEDATKEEIQATKNKLDQLKWALVDFENALKEANDRDYRVPPHGATLSGSKDNLTDEITHIEQALGDDEELVRHCQDLIDDLDVRQPTVQLAARLVGFHERFYRCQQNLRAVLEELEELYHARRRVMAHLAAEPIVPISRAERDVEVEDKAVETVAVSADAAVATEVKTVHAEESAPMQEPEVSVNDTAMVPETQVAIEVDVVEAPPIAESAPSPEEPVAEPETDASLIQSLASSAGMQCPAPSRPLKRSLPEDEQDGNVGNSTPTSSPASSERPIKRSRALRSAVGAFVLGSVIGSASTIAGLLQYAD